MAPLYALFSKTHPHFRGIFLSGLHLKHTKLGTNGAIFLSKKLVVYPPIIDFHKCFPPEAAEEINQIFDPSGIVDVYIYKN
jgi:hypothetical protein